MLRGLCCILLTFFFCLPSHAQVQIIQASDLHSQYNHSLDFILAVSRLNEDFRKRHPHGKSILLLNGDLAGPSEWTDLDKGAAIYRVLAPLSNQFDAFAMTPGNHDGWSFSGRSPREGNVLFHQQTVEAIELFRTQSKHSGRLTAQNIEINSGYESLFQPHLDVPLEGRQRLRVVGLLADDLFRHSSYDPQIKPNPLVRILPALETAKEAIEIAARDGITDVIFMDHEGHKVIQEKILPPLLQWKNSHVDPAVKAIRLPVFFAAHTHLEVKTEVDGVPLIESGSRYQFSEVILDQNLRLQTHRLVGYDEQARLARKVFLPEATAKAVEVMAPLVEEMQKINGRVVFEGEGISVTRKDLRTAEHWFGQALANSLRESALRMQKVRKLQVDEVFGLFHSTGYRRDEAIPEGPVTYGDLKSFHPLPKDVGYAVLDGATLKKLIFSFREYVASSGDFSPHTSTNLTVHRDGKVFIKPTSQAAKQATLVLINDQGRYLVALDGFMGLLIRRSGEWAPWADRIEWLKTYGRYQQSKILADEFPKVYFQPDILNLRPRSCKTVHILQKALGL